MELDPCHHHSYHGCRHQSSRQPPHPRLHRSNNFAASPFKSESPSVGSSLTSQLQLELIMDDK
uniref:Uncharacterized protein n=1 Tax=Zea mays TaxID=4577 RepID=B6U3P4_MAIZE|nr:hypothetical protein [Zea mays]